MPHPALLWLSPHISHPTRHVVVDLATQAQCPPPLLVWHWWHARQPWPQTRRTAGSTTGDKGIHSHIWYVLCLTLPSHSYQLVGHEEERPNLQTPPQRRPCHHQLVGMQTEHIWYVLCLTFLPPYFYQLVGHKEERPDLQTTLQRRPCCHQLVGMRTEHVHNPWPTRCNSVARVAKRRVRSQLGATSPSLELVCTQDKVARSHRHPRPAHSLLWTHSCPEWGWQDPTAILIFREPHPNQVNTMKAMRRRLCLTDYVLSIPEMYFSTLWIQYLCDHKKNRMVLSQIWMVELSRAQTHGKDSTHRLIPNHTLGSKMCCVLGWCVVFSLVCRFIFLCVCVSNLVSPGMNKPDIETRLEKAVEDYLVVCHCLLFSHLAWTQLDGTQKWTLYMTTQAP